MTPMTLFDALSRDDDPSTSQQAAQGDRTRIADRALEIIRVAGWSGATCDEVHAVFEREGWGHRWSSTSRRITSLRKAGLVEPVGTRRAESGKQQQVWRAVGHMMKEAV